MNDNDLKILKTKSDIEYWIKNEEIEEVQTSRYWNDEKVEKEKLFYSIDLADTKAINHIRKSGLEETFNNAVNLSKKKGNKISGVVLDIAAGVGFTSAIISKNENVNKVYCIDISEHRLKKIAPVIFKQYDANEEKIVRIVGSFYNIKLDDSSVDLVVMSQAFHHALEPKKMLSEIYRVLKKSGLIIITGEKIIGYKMYLLKLLKKIINDLLILLRFKKNLSNQRLFSYQFRDLFPSNETKGDTHYTLSMVRRLFYDAGFEFKHYPSNSSVQKRQNEYIYIIKKNKK